eukprot:TRINITY_DN5396_c0_g1_i9.p1 TRINITY_DN5396_c0_g1~~TRINITY_DN5396_c0_g1_i9.p1  ORF type:complete len:381 (+),score=137.23 TRINITY_DN5396_c0_g1_i9:1341-2483(+)
MSLRHGNLTKWAKNSKLHAKNNPNIKQDLHEHYERQKLLKKRIEVDSSVSSEEEEMNLEFSSEESDEPKTGLFAMKFMKRADDRKKAEINEIKQQMMEEEDEFERQRINTANKINGNDDEIIPKKESKKAKDEVGRKEFKPKRKHGIKKMGLQTSEVALGKGFSASTKPIKIDHVFDTEEFPEIETNEMDEEDTTFNLNKTKVEVKSRTNKPRTRKSKQAPAPEKKKPSQTKKKAKPANDGANPWLKTTGEDDEIVKPKASKKKRGNKTAIIDVEAIENEVEEDESFNLLASASEAQKDIIKRAFAGDDVEADFAAEKAAIISETLPEMETALPGWGSWSGAGVKEQPKPRNTWKQREHKKKVNQIKNSRKDTGKKTCNY